MIWDYKILEGSANDEVQMNFLNIKALKIRAILFYASSNEEPWVFLMDDYLFMHIEMVKLVRLKCLKLCIDCIRILSKNAEGAILCSGIMLQRPLQCHAQPFHAPSLLNP